MLEVIAPPPQGRGLKLQGAAAGAQVRAADQNKMVTNFWARSSWGQGSGRGPAKNGDQFLGPIFSTTLSGGLDFATGKWSSFFATRAPPTKNQITPGSSFQPLPVAPSGASPPPTGAPAHSHVEGVFSVVTAISATIFRSSGGSGETQARCASSDQVPAP